MKTGGESLICHLFFYSIRKHICSADYLSNLAQILVLAFDKTNRQMGKPFGISANQLTQSLDMLGNGFDRILGCFVLQYYITGISRFS